MRKYLFCRILSLSFNGLCKEPIGCITLCHFKHHKSHALRAHCQIKCGTIATLLETASADYVLSLKCIVNLPVP